MGFHRVAPGAGSKLQARKIDDLHHGPTMIHHAEYCIYIYIARDLDIQIYGVDTNFDCLFVELNSFLLSTATDD